MIAVKNIDFAYERNSGSHFRLHVKDLTFKQGEVTAVLGKSGCGKTTLLSILGLLHNAPTSEIFYSVGEETFSGERLWDDEKALNRFRAHHMGFALQRGELLPFLSNQENVSLAGASDHIDLSDYLKQFQFAEHDKTMFTKRPGQVSQGQYLRVGAARALAHCPPILLADEPTGALDRESKRAIADMIQSHAHDKGGTVIIVTHDLSLAHSRADQIVLLDDGAVTQIYKRGQDWPSLEVLGENFESTGASPTSSKPADSPQALSLHERDVTNEDVADVTKDDMSAEPFKSSSHQSLYTLSKVKLSKGLTLGMRELVHYWQTTLLLMLIVCFVCLPLLFLGTLRTAYINMLMDEILAGVGLRVDVSISNPSSNQNNLTTKILQEIEQRPEFKRAVPMRLRGAQLYNESGTADARFDIIPIIDHDPELEKLGYQGPEKLAINEIILHERHKRRLKLKGIGEKVDLQVTRSYKGQVEDYFITLKVAGFVETGDQRLVYGHLELLNDLNHWTSGYAVKREGWYELPPAPDREAELAKPQSKGCHLWTERELTDVLKRQLENIGGSLSAPQESEHSEGTTLDTAYRFIFKKARSVDQCDMIKEFASAEGQAVSWPMIELNASVGTQSVKLTAQHHLARPQGLQAGTYLSEYKNSDHQSRLKVIVTKDLINEDFKEGQSLELQIQGVKVPIVVTGVIEGEGRVLAHPELVGRLQQVIEGVATFDTQKLVFGALYDQSEGELYQRARLYLRDIKDVKVAVKYLEDHEVGLQVSSSIKQVKYVEKVEEMLNALLIFLGLTGIFAAIFAIAGIMVESVRRKRRQIGILRCLGFSRGVVTTIYITESVMCAFLGIILCVLVQGLLSQGMDSALIHELLGIKKDLQLFTASWNLRLQAIGYVSLIGLIAGAWPAYKASKISPLEVLQDS